MTKTRTLSIHHIDGNPYNDELANLVLIDPADPSRQFPAVDDEESGKARESLEAWTEAALALAIGIAKGDEAVTQEMADVVAVNHRASRKRYHDLIRKVRS